MYTVSAFTLRREFELRIFVSLGIVALICAASALISQGEASSIERLGALTGLSPETSRRACFLLLAAYMVFVSVLRMWAGTELSARRVMAFRVQVDESECIPTRMEVRLRRERTISITE